MLPMSLSFAHASILVAPRPPFLGVPEKSRTQSESSGGTGSAQYSSSTYRQQAANLMAQIRSDMKGPKRIFSFETDASQLTHVSDKSKTGSRAPRVLRGSTRSDDKENMRESSAKSASKRSTKSTMASISVKAPTPRRTAPSVAVSDDANRQLADGMSKLSVHDVAERCPAIVVSAASLNGTAAHLAPPPRIERSYPSSTVRGSTNEDLNRFVSSSTASGTTLTAGSTGSLAKHPGPIQIRRIGPEDVPLLPDRFGKMVLDKVMMRWVKTTTEAVKQDHKELGESVEGESDDPFRDIESLREDESVPGEEEGAMTRIEEVEESHYEEEEQDLNSFSFDDPSAVVVNVMTGVETEDDDQTTDSEDLVVAETDLEPSHVDGFDSEDESQIANHVPTHDAALQTPPQDMRAGAVPQVAVVFSTPLQPPAAQGSMAISTPVIRSALKSATTTPVSALKDSSRQRSPVSKSGHRRRRSVSFSDGKREGPIRGLGRNVEVQGPGPYSDGGSFVPSARSKRIAALMDDLEGSGKRPLSCYLKVSKPVMSFVDRI